MTQKQKIGASKGAGRICLWNRAMLTNGFPIGQAIHITAIHTFNPTATQLVIVPDKNGTRKVSGVMNHGNRLPVIDLKQTKSLDIGALGNIGDSVNVEISKNQITISKV